jgi:hypothetical protein
VISNDLIYGSEREIRIQPQIKQGEKSTNIREKGENERRFEPQELQSEWAGQ